MIVDYVSFSFVRWMRLGRMIVEWLPNTLTTWTNSERLIDIQQKAGSNHLFAVVIYKYVDLMQNPTVHANISTYVGFGFGFCHFLWTLWVCFAVFTLSTVVFLFFFIIIVCVMICCSSWVVILFRVEFEKMLQRGCIQIHDKMGQHEKSNHCRDTPLQMLHNTHNRYYHARPLRVYHHHHTLFDRSRLRIICIYLLLWKTSERFLSL